MNGWELPSLAVFALIAATCILALIAGYRWGDRTPTDDR